MMMHILKYFLLCVSTHYGQSLYRKVNRCPIDEELLQQSSLLLNCSKAGTSYHCMRTLDGCLVEFCHEIRVLKARDGCPAVDIKEGSISLTKRNCTNDDECPTSHFTSDDISKYKACLRLDPERKNLCNTRIAKTTKDFKGAPNTNEETFQKIPTSVLAATITILVLVLAVIITVIVCKRKRFYHRYEQPTQAVSGETYTEIPCGQVNPATNNCAITINENQGSSYLDPIQYAPYLRENDDTEVMPTEDNLQLPGICVGTLTSNNLEDLLPESSQMISQTYSYVQMNPNVSIPNTDQVDTSI